MKPNTAIIGNGSWSNILQKYIKEKFNIKYIADSKFDKNIIWKNDSVDSVFVVTPFSTLADITREALLNGKNVFVEKPLTNKVKVAYELETLAKDKGLKLFVDYPYRYSSGLLPVGIESINIKLHRDTHKKFKDINVHWVLTPHILSIIGTFFNLTDIKLYNSTLHTGLIYKWGAKAHVSLEKERETKIIFNGNEYVPKNTLSSVIDTFYNVIYNNYTSNINFAIKIIDTIEKGLK